jgi:O-glycosyl hydrolase/predicted RNase H-like HicB family nuclease
MKAYSALLISVALAAKVSADCWATRLGYPCCSYSTEVIFSDNDGQWSVENNDWCGIVSNQANSNCWASKIGYPCCKSTTEVIYTENDGQWGIENNDWCGIVKTKTQPAVTTAKPTPPPQRPKQYSKSDINTNVKTIYATNFNDRKFEGFGTSFCWWANRIGYSNSLSEKAATLFYDKVEGLGLTIIRYNIGGGDDPSHNHITRTDSNMPGYAINPRYSGNGNYSWDYNWNSDSNQRNALLKAVAKNREEILVEGFSNSPPYFMTNSGCSTGNFDPNKDNLRSDAYPAFAKYLADVAEHFNSAWGVRFQSMTPLNEPFTNFWGANSRKQEGCHFDQGNSESKIIVELRKAIDQRGLKDIQISGTDETSIDTQITSFERLSNEAKNIITRIDTHTYGGSKRDQLRILAENNKKNLWMSEVDGNGTDGTNAGEMAAGLWLANRIITDLNGLRPSAWVLWQVIDNHISKNGVNGKRDSGMVNVNGGYWGLAVADHDNDKIILTQKYYAFGQFTRYIRPGYTIIGCYNNSVAAYDSKGKKLVIVATNTSNANKTVDFNLTSFKSVGYNVRVIRTSGSINNGEHWAELPPLVPYGLGFNAELKGNSVTTFIVDDVEW